MKSSSSSSVPVIDLQKFPSESHNLIQACDQWGCFRIINHTIPTNLMSEMKSVIKFLLDLPAEVKIRNIDVIAGSGYVAPTKINPLYEALGLYDIGSSQAVREFCDQLEATPSQRYTIEKYSEAINELVMDIGRKICESLGLGSKNLFLEWPCQFRINKYSFTPEAVGSCGVQIHTDSGFLTILQDDENVGGLEVMDKETGVFLPIDPMPGSLLVNMGDLAKIWSNGRFYNVKHKVMCREASVRLSIALFVLGPKDTQMEAPAELLLDSDDTRLYVPVAFEEYRKLRLSKGMHAGEALSLLLQDAKQ
ncbi:2-oxoglutarate-dependent dioxygenase DAO-like [Impatiens glandulifera]|uniref:2-oxoglutarate-dependent dioxygenase DAO-like n=1 Tax=Impatiens glandulifera TaxID=253017 RepID=UPI001FB166F1|nr:2-oxoglutarate-dependent dioxygenase DAO-like [Impatiens glandulifera]